MKRILFLLSLSLFCFNLGIAQDNQYLEIDYELEMKLDPETVIKNIPAQYRAQAEAPIRAEIKNGIFIDYKLKTDGKKSVYKLQPKLNNSQNGAGYIAQDMINRDKEPYFKDLDTKTYLKKNNLWGKEFVVNDSLPNYKWTITREKDNIAGFEVRKAYGKAESEIVDEPIEIVAWFAPKLKFKDGPDRAWGLPGIILKTEVEIKDQGANVIIIAKEVKVNDGTFEINLPKSEKTYTQKEFEQSMKEIMEQWQNQSKGGVDTSE